MKRQISITPLLLCAISATAQNINQERPNIVVLIADDISRDDFGCYGNNVVKTPNIDALASTGIRFNNVFLTASSSSPSRTSIITGRYPHNTGACELHSPIGEEQITIAGELKEAGYYTMQSGKWHFGRSYDNIYGPILDDFYRVGESNGEDWAECLINRDKDKPFFAWFASNDAHRAWDDDDSLPRYKLEDIEVPDLFIDDEATREDFANYYYEVSRFDYHVGEVVKELKRQGIFDETLIIVMADNGRPFIRAKTRLLTDGIQTPFIVSYPNYTKVRGEVSNSLISVIDMAPTFAALAGIEASDSFQGRSFLPLLNKPTQKFRNYTFAEHNWHDYEAYERMVSTGQYLLIINSRPQFNANGAADVLQGESSISLVAAFKRGELDSLQNDSFIYPRPAVELYDYIADPTQSCNLTDKKPKITKKLTKILELWQEQSDDTIPEVLTEDNYERLSGKGFGKKVTLGTMPGSEKNATLNRNEIIF